MLVLSIVIIVINRRMIQLQIARQSALSALTVSSRMNHLLTNDEAECGAVTSDELGKLDRIQLNVQMLKTMMDQVYWQELTAEHELILAIKQINEGERELRNFYDQGGRLKEHNQMINFLLVSIIQQCPISRFKVIDALVSAQWAAQMSIHCRKALSSLVSWDNSNNHFESDEDWYYENLPQFYQGKLSIIIEENSFQVTNIKNNKGGKQIPLEDQTVLENIQNNDAIMLLTNSQTYNNDSQPNQSKKRKFDQVQGCQKVSKKRKLNNDLKSAQNDFIPLLELHYKTAPFPKMNQEERQLFKARQEVMKFKEEYSKWQSFYERKVKKRFFYKTDKEISNDSSLKFKIKRRPRTPTKIKPFFFQLDMRMSFRPQSCMPMNEEHRPIIKVIRKKRRSNSISQQKSKDLIQKQIHQENIQAQNHKSRKSQSVGPHDRTSNFFEFDSAENDFDFHTQKKSLRDKSEQSTLFKARKMPDFGNLPSFIPLLNDRPLTFPQEFNFKVEQRLSKKKQDANMQYQMETNQYENDRNKENIHPWIPKLTIPKSPLLHTKRRAQMRPM
ncbi:UNKNOWN [Stylonychia lemnae]|uniref:Uncharacterized protein n=1 Tax=Stylonychia lemnae TaxID=5949 RepID=A0A078B1F5_STYLE|nr:UNKNOWN [Stylonychia lemnae]|eukprot:CDW88146.1 UNKNOWN [Stylonychia lemnae]